MKMPPSPPPSDDIWNNADTIMRVMQSIQSHLVRGKYLHWDKLRFCPPPEGLSTTEWWQGIKFRRSVQFKAMPLRDKDGKNFVYLIGDPIPEILHRIDLGAGGHIAMRDQITNPESRDQYYVSSLMDEAITSSQLEAQRLRGQSPRR